MPVTFGGSPLVCEDAGGRLQGWLDQYLAIEDLRDQSKSASLVSHRADSRSGYRSAVSLPRPNYPAPPRAKLFTLYWPTGASRWAKAYYLATDSQLEAIGSEIDEAEGNSTLPLVISDGTNEITTEMYMLPPRRITAITPEGPTQGLWLLPLVDVRYYWQSIDAGPFRYGDDNDFTTWTGVFEKLSTQLGVTIEEDDTSAYNIPDPDELTRSYENIAVLLDGIAHSLGQRIVRQLDGTVTSSNWETSAASLEENAGEPAALLGGEFSEDLPSAVVPEKVRVVFPKWYYGAVDPYGGLYASDQEASDFTETTPIKGLVKTIHTCAFADFSLASSGPDNATEVNALAKQLATDFYDSLAFRYDYSFGGVRAWELSGYDDHVEWCFGRKHHLPTYQAFTRVQSAPSNFGTEEQLSQFKDTPVYPSLTRFKLDAALSPGGNAMGFHVKFQSGSYSATTDKIKVYDFQSKFSGQKGAQGWAQFKGDSLRWEVVEMDAIGYAWATVLSDVTFGGSSSASVIHFSGSDPGSTITAFPDDTYDGTTIKAGKKVRCVYDAKAQKYWIVGAQC
jgi:hypothetical protein